MRGAAVKPRASSRLRKSASICGPPQIMARSCPATDLGAVAIRAAVERAGIAGDQVDEVFMGQVIQAGAGQAPARQAARKAGLPDSVSATTVNKVCGSGLKAVMLGAAAIRAGDANLIVAGGMENMNLGPYLLRGAR